VLAGPQSSLWGSDAIGGVISITTREPQGLALSAEGGSLATVRCGPLRLRPGRLDVPNQWRVQG
jgi:hypothetical protein